MTSETKMVNLQTLFDFISGSTYEAAYATAKATRTCVMCGKPARIFQNASARLEYDVSALCQLCQNNLFR